MLSREEVYHIKSLLSSPKEENYTIALYLLQSAGILPPALVELLERERNPYYKTATILLKYSSKGLQVGLRTANIAIGDSLSELAKIPNLVELKLLQANIYGLPDNFKELKHLQKLDISQNYNLSLSTTDLNLIFALEELRILNLSHCYLEKLPTTIAQLKKLEVLYLEYNSLKELPTSLKELKQLTYLGLKNNQLQRVPEGVLSLKELGFLDVENNPLIEPQKKTLSRQKKHRVIKY